MPSTPSKRTALGVIVMFATLTAGCRGGEPELAHTPPVPIPTIAAGAPPSATGLPSEPPSGSPGVTGNLTVGAASVTTTGGLIATATYDTLFTPGIWTLPPGAISLSWRAKGRQALSITGPSFTAQLPTEVDRVLEFSLPGPDGLLTFRSSGGECLVTISPALADQMGGSFICTALTSSDGTITVNAQGSFSAE
jgi:hypothetical protein